MKRSKGKKIQPQLHLFGKTNYFVCATESNVKGKNNNNCSIWNWNTSCAAVRQKAPHRNITLNVNFFVLNVLKKWKISKEKYQRVYSQHTQTITSSERASVCVGEWVKEKSWRNNVNCRALYFKLRPVRETLSFTNSFPSSWEKNLDTIKGEFQSEQESNFSLRRKKIYI